MVSRLLPLRADIQFEKGLYELGETVDLIVELTPRGDVEVRKGRVDLVCEVRYEQRYTVMARVSGLTSPHYGAVPPQGVSDEAKPRQFIEEHKKTYIRSSVVFLKKGQLRSGTVERYSTRLKIPPKPPPHARSATFLRWQIVAAIDIAQARDITKRRTIKVNVKGRRTLKTRRRA